MNNKKKDTFDDLLFTNGKEETQQSEILAEKPTKRKSIKNKINKKSYSYEDLKGKSSDQLTKICEELNIPIVRRKVEMIEKILNSN